MVMGVVGSTVYYNLKLRHPTLDMPIIYYDLALLFQPMLMMGISIGMVTILLIVLFLGTSTKPFLKGVETWKKETIMEKVIIKFAYNGMEEVEYKPLPSGLSNGTQNATKKFEELEVRSREQWTRNCKDNVASQLHGIETILEVGTCKSKRFTSSELKFAITRDFSLAMVIGESGHNKVYPR
ncbi:hypothetical protein AAG906_005310 [Vitis piasezkii]